MNKLFYYVLYKTYVLYSFSEKQLISLNELGKKSKEDL